MYRRVEWAGLDATVPHRYKQSAVLCNFPPVVPHHSTAASGGSPGAFASCVSSVRVSQVWEIPELPLALCCRKNSLCSVNNATFLYRKEKCLVTFQKYSQYGTDEWFEAQCCGNYCTFRTFLTFRNFTALKEWKEGVRFRKQIERWEPATSISS